MYFFICSVRILNCTSIGEALGILMTSEGGASSNFHFVENILTVVATCRQQERNVLDYLAHS